MNQFDEKIRAMELEVEALKSIRRRNAANLTTTTSRYIVQPVIRGEIIQDIGHVIKTTAPLKNGVITVETDIPAFVSIGVVSSLNNRQMNVIQRMGDANTYKFAITIIKGNDNDIAELDGNPDNTKTLDVEIDITATANFTATITQEDA